MCRTAQIAIVICCLCCTIGTRAGETADLPPSHSIKPQLYATGFEFAEGPALDDAGNLFVVNYRGNGKIGRIAPDGTASVYCDLREHAPPPAEGRKAQANGLKVDAEGRLIVADAGGGRILRITGSPDGKTPKIEVLAETFENKPLDAPNDVALDRIGNIYFSDPGNSNAEKPTGSIYRIAADGGRITKLDTGLAYPNGLAVTPNQGRLCLSESARYRVLIYDLQPDGGATHRRVLIDFPKKTEGNIGGGRFEPDGMIFDSSGRLYVAMWTGGVINVVEVPSGKLLRQYDAGGRRATNCHFHGGYLYTTVAAKEAVFRLELGVEGFDYRRSP
ncbi:MAG: SMP-30/gluconolactonase/LRE family protein [Planctomycetes bacterium]|nr:SMP-30/gluconolactonase/LRE family protein [Planctomycetota bacterium]MCG2685092.1 SMP-30/gluconolactonase/LRE family protein [Planctomycetales bacterium]